MKVAVICVGFIRYDFHALFALQTALSIANQKSVHEIIPILVVNEVRNTPDDLAALSDFFQHILINDKNNLSRAWNKGLSEAFHLNADYCLIVNMDVVLPTFFIDNLVSFALKNPELIVWSGTAITNQENLENEAKEIVNNDEIHFSCFMVDRRLLSEVGGFDEQFGPAYHEDADMAYRLRLLKLSFACDGMSPFFHLDQVSLKGAMVNNDEAFLLKLRLEMNESMRLYECKWGGLPGAETFLSPYNKIKE
jgi:GT2 family glycosyltransferase